MSANEKYIARKVAEVNGISESVVAAVFQAYLDGAELAGNEPAWMKSLYHAATVAR